MRTLLIAAAALAIFCACRPPEKPTPPAPTSAIQKDDTDCVFANKVYSDGSYACLDGKIQRCVKGQWRHFPQETC